MVRFAVLNHNDMLNDQVAKLDEAIAKKMVSIDEELDQLNPSPVSESAVHKLFFLKSIPTWISFPHRHILLHGPDCARETTKVPVNVKAKQKISYIELGSDYFEQRRKNDIIRKFVKGLENLGFTASIEPQGNSDTP